MKKIIIASILGGLTIFVWGAISWVALPFHKTTIHSLTNEDAVVAALKAGGAATGAYMIPGFADSKEVMDAKAEAGPLVHIYYRNEGMPPMDPMFFIKGILLDIVVMWLAVMMLSKISWSLASYGNRVRFMAMIGLIIAIGVRLGDTIYFGYPFDFIILIAIDEVIAWTLAGLVVARIVKPSVMKAA